MMGSSTGFHSDLKAPKVPEEFVQILPAQLSPQRRLLAFVNTMQLENTLGRIHTNARKLPHGRLPCLRIFNDLNLAHSMPSGPSTPTLLYGNGVPERIRTADCDQAAAAENYDACLRRGSARAAGRAIVTHVPSPGSLTSVMCPPCASQRPLTIASPSPVPFPPAARSCRP